MHGIITLLEKVGASHAGGHKQIIIVMAVGVVAVLAVVVLVAVVVVVTTVVAPQ